MKVTREKILKALPGYEDSWQLVREKQFVPDIINEIITAHKLFCRYYDCFSSFFMVNDVDTLADNLYFFCEENIRYTEEPKERQTTALPTGILIRGYGDCKHYASFCGGVISSLNRVCGAGIEWYYYFAGYRGNDGSIPEEPYHVFVAIKTGDSEIWIDPTPGAGTTEPVLLIKKTV